jgi:hypothetical protein
MKLIRRSQRRPKTSNCSSLVVVLVLRGLGQVIQFLLLGLAKISAASAGVNREHLLVRLRRGGLKVCGLQRGQHFRIVGIIKLLADGDRLLARRDPVRERNPISVGSICCFGPVVP